MKDVPDIMSRTHASVRSAAARRRAAQHTVGERRGRDTRALAFFGAVGTAVLAGGVLLMQQLQPAPSPATGGPAAPAVPAVPATQEVDWKVKGAATEPVLVEEWGDFQ